MTDQELLEAAAKAAGLPIEFDEGTCNGWWPNGRTSTGDVDEWWNPMTDDGDALRLAVKLRLNITFTAELGRGFKNEFMQVSPRSLGHLAEFGPLGSDPSATLRLAIVRAAAAMAG